MRILIVTLLCFGCSAFAETFNEATFKYKGLDYVTKIPNNLKDTWIPNSSIPLSIEKAFALANEEYTKTFSKLGKFNLETIALNLQSKPNGWIYMIVYLQDSSEVAYTDSGNEIKQAHPLSLVYYVTMDGHVFGPSKN